MAHMLSFRIAFDVNGECQDSAAIAVFNYYPERGRSLQVLDDNLPRRIFFWARRAVPAVLSFRIILYSATLTICSRSQPLECRLTIGRWHIRHARMSLIVAGHGNGSSNRFSGVISWLLGVRLNHCYGMKFLRIARLRWSSYAFRILTPSRLIAIFYKQDIWFWAFPTLIFALWSNFKCLTLAI